MTGVKGPWTQEEEYYKEQLNQMSKLPENQECADCTSKAPRWAVYNHGIFVCIKCSGQHRNLGTGISKVRSINMDRWREDQFVQMVGNLKANAELMYNFPAGAQKPNEDDDYGRQKFIAQKYQSRKWARKEDQEVVEPVQSTSSKSEKHHTEVKAMVVPQPQVIHEQTPPKVVQVQQVKQIPQQHVPQMQVQQVQKPVVQPQQDLLDLFNDPVPVQKPTNQAQKQVQPQQIQSQAKQQTQPYAQVQKPVQNDIFGDIMQMYDKPGTVAPVSQSNQQVPTPKQGFDISAFIGAGNSQQAPSQNSSYKPQGFQW